MKKYITLDKFMKKAFKDDKELKYEYDKLKPKYKLIEELIKLQNKYNINKNDMKRVFKKLDKMDK